MKKIQLFLFLFSSIVYGQELTVDSSSNITVENGASINIGGLELSPIADYPISGKTITYTNIPVVTGNTSINRVYNVTPTELSNYIGDIKLYYEDDDELNSIPEANLVLEVFEGNDWENYQPSDFDTFEDWIEVSFSSNLSFSSITASSVGSTLIIKDFEKEFGAIVIYPNPTTSVLKIDSNKNLSFELYSLFGQQILKTKNSTIEMSYLPKTVYLLKVTDEDSHFSKSYKIVKE
ncbi:T9SS type A sorting domain-containing protein [Hyunsoonleella aestuarii]|uniref:Secretion system C-terminal sorting domain-containing protein n=1 Tax=Hyunsoonleella aestuarii TaxID=912802 RepID=A0ABP8EEJ0_9FLAO|nr:T9SS type A sorting domain-containing protein [Hyunsoonleella aestuarii]